MRSIAGQGVIVATGAEAMRSNGLLTVSSRGEFILKNYPKTADVADMIRMVCEEFEVDEKTAAVDVINFTKTMLEMGFVEMDDPQKKWQS